MRVIDNIPHPSMSISIFKMNDKYIVKFEAGPMEQSFKFSTEEFSSVDALKTKLSAGFIETTRQRFNDMFLSMKEI